MTDATIDFLQGRLIEDSHGTVGNRGDYRSPVLLAERNPSDKRSLLRVTRVLLGATALLSLAGVIVHTLGVLELLQGSTYGWAFVASTLLYIETYLGQK